MENENTPMTTIDLPEGATVPVGVEDLQRLAMLAETAIDDIGEDHQTAAAADFWALGRIRAVLGGARYPSNPRTVSSIPVELNDGPGGIVIDARRATIVEQTMVCLVESDQSPGDTYVPIMGLAIGGHVNQSEDRADLLMFATVDGAAAIVAEIVGLGSRVEAFGVLLHRALNGRGVSIQAPTPPLDPGATDAAQ